MTVDIVIPQVGEAVAEVILVQWFKQEGDAVAKGEPLFEVDTDKVTIEVEAYADGTLAQILVSAGGAVMPQQRVGLLATTDDRSTTDDRRPTTVAAAGAGNGKRSPVALRMAEELGVDLAAVTGSGPGGRVTADDVRRLAQTTTPVVAGNVQTPRVLASPKARRVAAELGIGLDHLTGTGVDGLIRTPDVLAVAQAGTSPMSPAVEPFSRMRQAIAANTLVSKQSAPHFYLMADVDMTLAGQLRAFCKQDLGWEKAPTYTDLIVRAAGLALAEMPEVNIYHTKQGLGRRTNADVGVAVQIEGGIVTPVLRNADALSLGQTADHLRDLAARSRAGKLREGDLGDKSLTVSNLGMFGVDAFIAIIELPSPMILAVGAVSDRVVAVDGQPAVRPICTLTLSADHRVLDGAPAAQFLEMIKQQLEAPFALLG